MSTEWYGGRYFSLSPVLFVGTQVSRVSVYLSALTFLPVVFFDIFPRFFVCLFLRQGRGICCLCLLFFLSFLRVYHVHLFFVCFLSLPSSSSAFITSSFFLRICVYICLF